MARWAPLRHDVIADGGDRLRHDVIAALADEILHNYGHGRVIVAIDAQDIPAADAFGADLVGLLKKRGHSAFLSRLDDFAAPRDRRDARGADSAEGRYRDTYDYSALRRVLIEPFRMGGSTGFVAAHYDRARERQLQAKWLTAPEDAILVLTGEFLQRPELRGLWNVTVWLEGDPTSATEPADARTIAARKLYGKDVKARESATAIIDISDPEHPLRVFADSC